MWKVYLLLQNTILSAVSTFLQSDVRWRRNVTRDVTLLRSLSVESHGLYMFFLTFLIYERYTFPMIFTSKFKFTVRRWVFSVILKSVKCSKETGRWKKNPVFSTPMPFKDTLPVLRKMQSKFSKNPNVFRAHIYQWITKQTCREWERAGKIAFTFSLFIINEFSISSASGPHLLSFYIRFLFCCCVTILFFSYVQSLSK